jgi:hypothetical protein
VSGLQRERTKLAILQEAVIVASTLSFAGAQPGWLAAGLGVPTNSSHCGLLAPTMPQHMQGRFMLY